MGCSWWEHLQTVWVGRGLQHWRGGVCDYCSGWVGDDRHKGVRRGENVAGLLPPRGREAYWSKEGEMWVVILATLAAHFKHNFSTRLTAIFACHAICGKVNHLWQLEPFVSTQTICAYTNHLCQCEPFVATLGLSKWTQDIYEVLGACQMAAENSLALRAFHTKYIWARWLQLQWWWFNKCESPWAT